MLFHDAPFRRTLRISFEQSGRPAKSGRKHQAIVVRPHRPGDLVASGSEHVEMRSTVIELIAFFFYRDFHSRSLGLRNDRRQVAHRLVDTQPEFSRVKICNHRGHPTEMVSMRTVSY